jgi:hypothetical protein
LHRWGARCGGQSRARPPFGTGAARGKDRPAPKPVRPRYESIDTKDRAWDSSENAPSGYWLFPECFAIPGAIQATLLLETRRGATVVPSPLFVSLPERSPRERPDRSGVDHAGGTSS